ncbi:glycoside hydrolase family 43 protein [Dothistroma septosporum NZE10]|uniref:Glycoside hydrolase family 43 protein n=1 Tax=Dothistroma septosporum (strain NZE10 / CBS 128990) TaxID=675120 RepID=N1PD14_DOTSN|nr:glycoside hydrolase family 43 protein [Dothistroma septosporum NZE10]
MLLKSLVFISLLIEAAESGYGSSQAGQVIFTNTHRLLFDTNSNQIDAYGSKVNFFNGSYYLYGNSFSIEGVAFGIKSYSSTDLENWYFNGFLYNPNSVPPYRELGGYGRPHIVYNANSEQYILWTNAGSSGYMIATSTSPSGPFNFLNQTAAIDPQFNGLQPSDHTVEILSNGTGYLVFGALNFRDPRVGSIWPPIFQGLHISELTSDYENTTFISYPVRSSANDLIDEEAESPDLFERNGWFYVSASNTCGYCNGSIGLLYRSRSWHGPWTRQIIAGYSCDGQVEGVLPLTDPETKQVSYVWHSTTVPGGPRVGFSGHIFQPLKFNPDGSVQDLDCSAGATFQVPFTAGSGAVATGNATKAIDGTPRDVVYTPVCDSDQSDLFQTWKASKSGTLRNVFVNIARSVQTVPLALTVFKFDSYDDLIAPRYKWNTLGSVSYNATALSYTFDTTSVPITSNSTIKAGDLLGLAITGSDFAPYCHLEYNHSGDASRILFQRGAGQSSWRGPEGRTSPVYKREGRGVKVFSVYA